MLRSSAITLSPSVEPTRDTSAVPTWSVPFAAAFQERSSSSKGSKIAPIAVQRRRRAAHSASVKFHRLKIVSACTPAGCSALCRATWAAAQDGSQAIGSNQRTWAGTQPSMPGSFGSMTSFSIRIETSSCLPLATAAFW